MGSWEGAQTLMASGLWGFGLYTEIKEPLLDYDDLNRNGHWTFISSSKLARFTLHVGPC